MCDGEMGEMEEGNGAMCCGQRQTGDMMVVAPVRDVDSGTSLLPSRVTRMVCSFVELMRTHSVPETCSLDAVLPWLWARISTQDGEGSLY